MGSDPGYLSRHRQKLKLGRWRALYLLFIERLDCRSLVEVGAGSPESLSLAPAAVTEKHAIDAGNEFQADFERRGAVFHQCDLDAGAGPELRNIDVAVCSDVFEHLRTPLRTLGMIADMLGPEGVLFSHVPNEFLWRDILPILRGRKEAVLYHGGFEEWENPHLRRFSDIGFRRFLETRFTFNLKITEFHYEKWPRRLVKFGIPVPFGMEPGPTYASTNSPQVYQRLCAIKEELLKNRKATRSQLRELYRKGEELGLK